MSNNAPPRSTEYELHGDQFHTKTTSSSGIADYNISALPHIWIDGMNKDAQLTNTNRKVPRFVVFGKPSTGKSNLCQRISEIWGCEYVNASKIITDNVTMRTPVGFEMMRIMREGYDLSDEYVFNLLKKKLYSPECLLKGYILDDIPTNSEAATTIENQLEFLRSLQPSPNCFINIEISDEKHRAWWELKRIDPETGNLCLPSQCAGKDQLTRMLSPSSMQFGKTRIIGGDMRDRLVCRHEELQQSLDKHFEFYNNEMKPKLERFLGEQKDIPVLCVRANDMCSDLFENTIQALYQNSGNPALKNLDLFGELGDQPHATVHKLSEDTVAQSGKSRWKWLQNMIACRSKRTSPA